MFTTRNSTRANATAHATAHAATRADKARRTTRRAAVALAAGGAVAVAGLATAVPAQALGFTSAESCTGLSGTLTHSPGLVKKQLRQDHSVLTGTLAGCSGINGPQDGTGTITIVVDGQAKVGSVHETGTFVVNWPAAAGLNPSTGTVSVSRAAAQDPYAVFGSVRSGAYTGAQLSTSLFVSGQSGVGTKASPLQREQVVNTTPLAVRVNLG